MSLPTAKELEPMKEAALEIARRQVPDADDYRPQLAGTELCVHAWKGGVAELLHTEVFIDSWPAVRDG